MGDIKTKSNIDIVKEDVDITVINKGPWLGIRHLQTLLMFLLLTIGYAMRVNLSVGIVTMNKKTSDNPNVPVYHWNNKSLVLSSFFMGYISLQVFAGLLGKIYGPKWFLVGAMVINSAGCMLTPIMADTFGSYGVMGIRIVQGMFQGFFFPSVHNILGKWAPETERSTLGNFIFTGAAFGTIFAIPVTGLIAESWYGWPLAFYFFGGVGLLWCAIWIPFGSNSPQEHKFISPEEKFYIQSSLGDTEEKPSPPTPWKPILTSWPVWAIVVANFGQNWGYATLLTEIPNYLDKVANQDISNSSYLSAAPYLALFILGLGFGPLADWLVNKNILTPVQTRKVMNSIGSVGPAVALSVLGFVPSDNIVAIETLLVIAVGINAAIWSGFQVNHVDLSPKFSGVLMGIGNGSSNIFSVLSPLFVQLIVTGDETDVSQWRVVFIVAAIIYVLSDIFYVMFAKAERQWWDNVDNEVIEADSNTIVSIVDSNEAFSNKLDS